MIYLDNAATTFPKPDCVIAAALNVMKEIGANTGRTTHKSAIKAGEIVYNTRSELANMFNCESERVIFTHNCTAALNTAIIGSVKKGAHIIISSMEHNSVLRPVHSLKEKGLITYSVARVNPLNDDETIINFASLINKDTSVIVCSAASNVFGTVLPVTRIGKLCKAKQLRFIVDGAQGAGYLQIDMKKSGIDILCMPGHKGLFGLMGTGAMLLGENIDVEPLIYGGTGSFSMSPFQPEVYPDRLESGTLNLPGIASLGEGVRFINSVGGVKAIHEKEKYLSKILIQDLENMNNVILYRNVTGRKSVGIVPFNIKGLHSERVGEYLSENSFALRTGYHCSFLAHKNYATDSTGVVRISPGFFTTKKDIKKLIFSLNKIAMAKKL